MTSDGITHDTTALAVDGLTMLPSGDLDVLGMKADDILVLDETCFGPKGQQLKAVMIEYFESVDGGSVYDGKPPRGKGARNVAAALKAVQAAMQ
eukprot:8564853-Pyramimonas_sp.AAC.1